MKEFRHLQSHWENRWKKSEKKQNQNEEYSLTVLLVFFRYQFESHLQVHRFYHERSLTIIGRSFHRQVWWYIGHLLLTTLEGSSSSIPSFTWSFNSPHKTVFRNFLSGIRTHLIRTSGDSSSMFVVFGFDLIIKVWFVYIVLDLVFLGFYWRCSWSFFVVTPYLYSCLNFISFRVHYSLSVTFLSPVLLLFLFDWK